MKASKESIRQLLERREQPTQMSSFYHLYGPLLYGKPKLDFAGGLAQRLAAFDTPHFKLVPQVCRIPAFRDLS